MKKFLSLIMILLMSVCVLAGCGGSGESGSGGSDAASIETAKTLGDLMDIEVEDRQIAVYDDVALYAFKLGDTYYRARAALTAEQSQAYFDVDYADEDYEEQEDAILRPIVIDELETLNDQILSQDELDALVGKTGAELMDEGWTFSGHNLEDMEFWMNKGPFVYSVYFEGEVTEAEYDTFEDETDTSDLVVKKAEFSTFGDATNIDME